MNKIEVSIVNLDTVIWIDNVAGFCDKVLQQQDISDWEVSILLCDDSYIRVLNKEYRSKNEPTDVLSFSQGGGIHIQGETFLAGDIVISLDTLKRNASEYGATEEEELKRLLVHGLLHLTGLDHATNELDQPMLQRQEEIMSELSMEKIF